jgi:hypothetical protein
MSSTIFAELLKNLESSLNKKIAYEIRKTYEKGKVIFFPLNFCVFRRQKSYLPQTPILFWTSFSTSIGTPSALA